MKGSYLVLFGIALQSLFESEDIPYLEGTRVDLYFLLDQSGRIVSLFIGTRYIEVVKPNETVLKP